MLFLKKDMTLVTPIGSTGIVSSRKSLMRFANAISTLMVSGSVSMDTRSASRTSRMHTVESWSCDGREEGEGGFGVND